MSQVDLTHPDKLPSNSKPESLASSSAPSPMAMKIADAAKVSPDATPCDHDVGAEASLLPKAADRKGRAPSTWILKPARERTIWDFICSLDLCDDPKVYFERKIERGPPPVHGAWRENLLVLTHGLLPIYVQFASYKLFPSYTWNPWAAYLFYHLSFIYWAYTMVNHLHHYMSVYGTFHEDVRGRDLASDKQKDKLAFAILMYMILRTAGPFIMAFDRNETPFFTLLSPVKVGLWMVALDFFFYCYHRACHEVPCVLPLLRGAPLTACSWLWHVHRAHHGTKHPTPLLSILADDYQEVIEVIIVPLLATVVVRLTFWEAWAAVAYMVYIEAMGHSGIRAYWGHPILGWVLKTFKMDLLVEDHDLHHRYGRGGKSYGKATQIFDTIFGTRATREDCTGKY